MTSSSGAGKKKVLLVDDSETTLAIEKAVLDAVGCEIRTACDGMQALEIAANDTFDLIVMDVEMPKLGGFETCRRLRAEVRTRGIPVLLVTSRGDAQNIRTGFECGCDGYVRKPIRSAELLVRHRLDVHGEMGR